VDIWRRMLLAMSMLLANALLLALVVSGQEQSQQADTARFTGRVVEIGSNLPVAGARILLGASPPFDTSPTPQAISDTDGRFTFGALPGGRYSVLALKAGFIQAPSSTFELAPGQALDGPIVSIERGGVITGRVVDPSGNPVTDSKVVVLQRAGPDSRPRGPIYWPVPRFSSAGGFSQTNDIGEFRIVGLRSGQYFIGATPPPDVPDGTGTTASATRLVDTLYPGTFDATAAKPVAVVAGLTVADVVIRLLSAPPCYVSGIVVDEKGTPVQDATLTLEPSSGSPGGAAGTARTNADGEFAIELTCGSYTAIARAPIVRSAVPAPDPTRTAVVVGELNVTNLRIVVRRQPQ
jgi:hypothetical protein